VLQDAQFCDALQQTATLFNILPHTAAEKEDFNYTVQDAQFCNALQRTATHCIYCNILPHTATEIEDFNDA